MRVNVIDISHHRNGVAGAPFSVVLFEDGDGRRKVAVVFDEPGCCAVFDLEGIARGEISRKANGWRGDRYEAALREAIAMMERSDA